MFIKRDIHAEIEKYIASPEAIVLTGMRRTGKTTLLRMIYDDLSTKNKLFLDLENPLNQKYFSNEDYDAILDDLSALGMNTQEKMYVFLDEIQALPNIPSVVKYLLDHYQIKFFLSGSASYYVKNLFSESLAGRKRIFELFPFSFGEFLRFKGINPLPRNKKISEATYLRFSRYFNEYETYGGFPGVVSETSHDKKIEKIEDIFSSYWSLEIERLSDFRKKDRVRDLIFLLMQRIGSRLDISKISRELGVAKDTLNDYISFLRDTYLIFTMSPFSTNVDTEIRGAKKVYFIDSGIINHFARIAEGTLFENTCFAELRKYGKVQYYQKKTGQEIDFILNEKTAYEIKIMAQPQDRTILEKRSKQIGIKEYFVVSKKYAHIQDDVLYGFFL